MNSIKINKTLRRFISLLSGMAASLLLIYFTLLQLSNAIAMQRPDGFPLDSQLKIYGGFTLSLLLIIIAFLVDPSEKM